MDISFVGDDFDVSTGIFDETTRSLIVQFTNTATNYLKTIELLGIEFSKYFKTRQQMEASKKEICYYLRQGLDEDEKEILLSSDIRSTQTPERKELMKKRNNIQKKINRIYKLLADEIFPSFLPFPSQKSKTSTSNSKAISLSDNVEDVPLVENVGIAPSDERVLRSRNMNQVFDEEALEDLELEEEPIQEEENISSTNIVQATIRRLSPHLRNIFTTEGSHVFILDDGEPITIYLGIKTLN